MWRPTRQCQNQNKQTKKLKGRLQLHSLTNTFYWLKNRIKSIAENTVSCTDIISTSILFQIDLPRDLTNTYQSNLPFKANTVERKEKYLNGKAK